MAYSFSIKQIIGDLGTSLQIKHLSGKLEKVIQPSDDSVSAADLIGHFNLIHRRRIQVFGHQEQDYLQTQDPLDLERFVQQLCASEPLALIFSENVTPSDFIVTAAHKCDVPTFSSPRAAALIIDRVRLYFTKLFAPKTLLHGVFMDVLGLGVLIKGESGLGKSELGLELISRGHGFVADDAVDFTLIAPNTLEGRCPPLLQDFLEVRGLGLLDIRTIFGEAALRRKMRLRLVVHLQRKSEHDWRGDRLGCDIPYENILDTNVPKVFIPVDAGRNLAVLVEAAVRNLILRLRGIDSMAQFNEKQIQAMTSSRH